MVAVELSAMRQAEATVPAAWLPVLEALQDFATAQADKSDARMQTAHEVLLREAVGLLEAESMADADPKALDQAVVQAALTAVDLAAVTTGTGACIDTVGSETLSYYRADWRGTDADHDRLHDWCIDVVGAEAVASIDARLHKAQADGRRKAKLIDVLAARLGGGEVKPTPAQVFDLFTELYGDVGLLPGEVDVISAGTLLFFCIDFKADGFLGDLEARSAAQQSAVQAFIKRVDTFKHHQFAHFPVFGFLQGADVSDELVSAIVAATDMDDATVRDELNHSIGIMPRREVDKYIVHDVWGHGWQLTALDYEHMYQEMGRYADALHLDEQADSCLASAVSLRSCISGSGADVQLDASQFRQFVAAEIAERVPVALSAVIAEMLADVIEYKFLHIQPERREAMPSSSAFKDWPTKWDLSFHDTGFYFQQATKVFRWTLSPGKRRWLALRAELASEWDEATADRLLQQMRVVWHDMRGAYQPTLQFSAVDDGRVQVNVFTRFALALVSTHRVLSQLAQRWAAEHPHGHAFETPLEFLVLAVSTFYEQDRATNIWRIDEFLEGPLQQRCAGLFTTLASSSAVSDRGESV